MSRTIAAGLCVVLAAGGFLFAVSGQRAIDRCAGIAGASCDIGGRIVHTVGTFAGIAFLLLSVLFLLGAVQARASERLMRA
jgi:hypothetical protein